jgi:hypothetical protein
VPRPSSLSIWGGARKGVLGFTRQNRMSGDAFGTFIPAEEEKFPAVGRSVNFLKGHPHNPVLLSPQNLCGKYRADFSATQGTNIAKGQAARFVFALAVPTAAKQTIFTIPIDSEEKRYVPVGKFTVARSRDRGRGWKLLTKGFRQENADGLALRQAMTSNDGHLAGIYSGTSPGDSWHVFAHLHRPNQAVSAAWH